MRPDSHMWAQTWALLRPCAWTAGRLTLSSANPSFANCSTNSLISASWFVEAAAQLYSRLFPTASWIRPRMGESASERWLLNAALTCPARSPSLWRLCLLFLDRPSTLTSDWFPRLPPPLCLSWVRESQSVWDVCVHVHLIPLWIPILNSDLRKKRVRRVPRHGKFGPFCVRCCRIGAHATPPSPECLEPLPVMAFVLIWFKAEPDSPVKRGLWAVPREASEQAVNTWGGAEWSICGSWEGVGDGQKLVTYGLSGRNGSVASFSNELSCWDSNSELWMQSSSPRFRRVTLLFSYSQFARRDICVPCEALSPRRAAQNYPERTMAIDGLI